MSKVDKETNKNELTSGQVSAAARSAGSVWEGRLLWLLVIILLGYWGHGWIRQRVDPEIRIRALKILRDRYPQHIITLESAHLVEGKAIVLDGLRIALPGTRGTNDVARIGRITASGNFSLLSLGSGDITITQVHIDDCNVSIWPVNDKVWSLQTLTSSGPLPEQVPPIYIRSGIVKLQSEPNSADEIICHDLKARFRINHADAALADRPYEWQALIRSNYFDLVSVYGSVSQDKNDWALQGSVTRCNFTPELTSRLPKQFQQSLTQVSGLDGYISSTFGVQKPRDGAVAFEVRGDISNGKLIHPRLPYPLEQLAGRIYCRNDMLQLREATARSGDATFTLNADVYGMSASVPIIVDLDAKQLPLDDRLYRVLSPKLKATWDRLQLSGMADAAIRFAYDGTQWQPTVNAQFRSGTVTFAEFPYPVSDLTGRIHLTTKSVLCDQATGMAGGSPIHLRLAMNRDSDVWTYDAEILAEKPIKIDDQLLDALSPIAKPTTSAEQFVRSLRPSGLVHVRHAKFSRKNAQAAPQQSIRLEFERAAIAYQAFEYPVFDIHGSIAIDNSRVTIESLSGQNDSANIHCQGVSICDKKGLHSLQLSFNAFAVPLEEELHRALPQGTRQLWDAIQPSGVVDHVAIDILQPNNETPLDIAVRIVEKAGESKHNSRSVTIRPKEIPYPLTDISCQISYRNGIATIDQISGQHDVSYVTAQGEFLVAADGTWNGEVQWLPQTRVIVDQSFLTALPGYLQQPILNSAFRGPVGVIGTTSFTSSGDGNSISVRDWNLELAIEEGRLGWGQIASGIRGSVYVRGQYDGTNILAKGQLALDSLLVYNVPVLELRGPFAIVEGNLLLGRDSDPVDLPMEPNSTPVGVQPASYQIRQTPQASLQPQNIAMPVANASLSNPRDPNFLRPADDPQLFLHASDVMARCLGGKLYLRGKHNIMGGRSEVSLQLQEAELREMLMDLSQNAKGVSGKVWAECNLQGSLFNQQTWTGRGQAWLRHADLVQLPVMTRLFRVLSIKDPEGGAFESGELRFGIDGDRVPIDALSLDGDIISLRGKGSVNMRREINLEMFAYVGKRSVIAALLGPIVSNNDNASLLAIEVGGTVDAMEFRQSLSLMNPNAAQLFPERFFVPTVEAR